MRRADIELLRLSLTFEADARPHLANDKARFTLANNAEKYYRGTKGYALRDGDVEVAQTAHIREVIASCLCRGVKEPLRELEEAGVNEERIRAEIWEMIEDCELPGALMQQCGLV